MTNDESPYQTDHRLGRPLKSQDIPWAARVRVLGIWLLAQLLIILILVARMPFSGQVTVQEGDVAPREIVASRQVTYVSEILTAQRRVIAASAVPEVYDPPQARIGRQQLSLAGQILEYLLSVRSDSYADPAAKTAYINAITGLSLSPQVISRIISLPRPAWERVASEVQVVLDRAMREEIRENNLADERRKVPARVALDLPDEDAAIVSAIVENLLVPNSVYNPERTEQRRQAARDAVQPVTRTVERNETILRAGDLVADLEIETLKALGLQQRSWSWEDVQTVTGFVLFLGVILLYYLWRQEPQLWLGRVEMLLLAIDYRDVRPGRQDHDPRPHLAAFPVSLRCADHPHRHRPEPARGAGDHRAVPAGVGWLTGGNLELMAFALGGSLVGALKLRRGDRLANFAWATLYVAAANLLVIAAFQVAGGHWDVRGLVELGTAALINSLIAIMVTLLGLYLIGALFGIATPLQLLEISRPTHPLLRQLLLKAPGTYHHTLIVSNMAERAAEAIGADVLLTRVGAYYHDLGKTIRPYFFIENRTESLDPHARLDPYTSAQIIIAHVKDGIELARKYRLPDRVIHFIPEHHGTMNVSYFYHQAVQQAGSPDAVDKELFRYPGPKPQSRETAITMLADGAEATVRSKRPASVEELEQIVADSIQSRLIAGQLDECSLTVADLTGVRRAFVDVLRGLNHPRIQYPSEAAPQRRPARKMQNRHDTQRMEPRWKYPLKKKRKSSSMWTSRMPLW